MSGGISTPQDVSGVKYSCSSISLVELDLNGIPGVDISNNNC